MAAADDRSTQRQSMQLQAVQALKPLFLRLDDMLYIVGRKQALKGLNRIIVGEFGCSGISAHGNTNCSQAGLGWHIELYIPQTSCQASCLPLRPKSDPPPDSLNNSQQLQVAFLFLNTCCRCKDPPPPKTSL